MTPMVISHQRQSLFKLQMFQLIQMFKLFAWVDTVSLWNPSKIPAAFQTTSDRQAKCLATQGVARWPGGSPSFTPCPSPLTPAYLAVILKRISTYSIVKLEKMQMCFQYTTYIICKLCCWYLYIEPAVIIHMTGIDSMFFRQLKVYVTSTSVKFF